ncbi:MAG TPA: hypothetical protein VM869_26005 [Enhygromyxa sp.]|nr:hypothetical protein [Enhygromyxa sp.]
MRARVSSLVLGLVLGLASGCGDDEPSPSVAAPATDAETKPVAAAPVRDPVEAVHDCATLTDRAARVTEDLVLLPILCPGVSLDHGQTRTIVLALASASAAARAIPALDANPELQGVVRLAALDRSSQPMPSELPDPATALLTPIDDRTLAAVELAYAMLRSPAIDETQRTRAHAFLARVHMQAIQSLGLLPGRPLPPLARLLAGPALFHGRNFCRFYWQRRVAGLERTFAETELDMLALLIDLDNTAHAGDPGLLAIERQRTRSYLLRSGPSSRIAKRAQQRPEARALGTELLLPLAHELGRLVDHGFVDLALDEGLRAGAEASGYGLDPMVALLTEDLRERDLREYERRLARRVERARKSTPSGRLEGSRELEPELPVEWPSAAVLAERARAWLGVAHGRGPDFARRHALGRVVLMLGDRPDAVRELLTAPADDAVVHDHDPLLLALLDARDGESLAALRLRVATAEHVDAETAARRGYALAARDALLHPR